MKLLPKVFLVLLAVVVLIAPLAIAQPANNVPSSLTFSKAKTPTSGCKSITGVRNLQLWWDGVLLHGTTDCSTVLNVPLEAGTPIAKTVQAAAITTANIYAAAPAGLYRVSYYLVLTRAAATGSPSSAVQITVGWNDGSAAQTKAGANVNGNTLGAFDSGSVIVRSAAAQNITYAVSYASVGTTAAQYAVYVTVEAL